MVKQIAIGLLVIVAAGCSGPQPSASEVFGRKAEESVKDALKDPTSAKFKGVQVAIKRNCIYGQILSKNGLGAYDGYHDFVWINGNTFIKYPVEKGMSVSTDDLNNMAAYSKSQMDCIDLTDPINNSDLPQSIPD